MERLVEALAVSAGLWLVGVGVAAAAPKALSPEPRCNTTTAASAYCRGKAHFNDTSLDGFGANGRACATCHVPEEAFQLSPATVERRYAALLAARALDPKADDPLFRPIDADDYRTKGDAATEYSNLRRGLIRISIPLPPNVRLIDPRTDRPTDETVADVFRAVPSIFNVAITGPDRGGPVWRRGPNPPLNALERKGKEVFERSCSSCHGSEKHPSTSTVTSPPLMQRYHPIESACPRPRQAWCARLGCFTFPPCDPALERNVRTYETDAARWHERAHHHE